jgi:repressor LexA
MNRSRMSGGSQKKALEYCKYLQYHVPMNRNPELTVRQEQVLTFYKDHQRQTGLFPTLQEAADHFGFKSPNAVSQHLRLAEKKGVVRRFPGRSRAIEFVQRGARSDSDSIRVPLLGNVPAGNPVIAYEDAAELLTLPVSFFHGSELFALRVRGTSMQGAAILDGDIAVLDGAHDVKEGAIAAVLIEDEATLKRVYHTPEALILKAENQAFRDIRIAASESQQPRVLGVLVGILRKV